MVDSLSTDSAQAHGDKSRPLQINSVSFVQDASNGANNFEQEPILQTSIHDPCSERVGGGSNFSSQPCSSNKVNSFDLDDAFPTSSESDIGINFDASCADVADVAVSNPQGQFSAVQIECPVVIEVFCGSARVTASLKDIGFSIHLEWTTI